MDKIILQELITSNVVQGLARILTELQCIYRHSGGTNNECYNELNKQGLNIAIVHFLATEAKNAGLEVDMTKFPKISMLRAAEKLMLHDIREDYIKRILKKNDITIQELDSVIKSLIEYNVGADFAKFITLDKNCLELRIFMASVKLATSIELDEICRYMYEDDYKKARNELDEVLKGYNDLPGFSRISDNNSEEMKIFRRISALRFRIRWSGKLSTVKCAVLGHNLETGYLAYLMSLKEFGNEDIATSCFWIGVNHDIPETYTGDMPKQVKDAITGLRQAMELFEEEMMEDNVYSKLLTHLRDAAQKTMSVKIRPREIHDIVELADRLSAAFECLRNIIKGSLDPYFKSVVDENLTRFRSRWNRTFYDALDMVMWQKSF